MSTFYSEDELKALGIKRYGKNVLIGRNAILYAPELLEIGNNVRIDDFAVISGKIVLGSYTKVSHFCCLYGGEKGIYMEDFSSVSPKVTIFATANDYSGNSLTNPMVPLEFKPGDKNEKVVLKKYVIIGCNSVILPGVVIEEGCAVGAMSMVYRSTKPFGIYSGIPVKRINERSHKLEDFAAQLAGQAEKASSTES